MTDASSLEFFQEQVATLEQELKIAQEELINELESRTAGVKPSAANATTAAHAASSSASSSSGWEANISAQETRIERLARELLEARSTCAFIIQRERDKIHLLSSTEDYLVSCMCLLVLDSEREIPQFLGDFHQWNESRGVTGVLHMFSSWSAVYIEGHKLVISQCVAWLTARCKLLRVLHKNGHPAGSPEAETPMKARKVPNCTLDVEWHSREMRRHQPKSRLQRRGVGGSNLQQLLAAQAEQDEEEEKHDENRDVIASMVDTLGRAAIEVIPYAHRPTYLVSQVQDLRHDMLNPSRLISTEALVWTPAQGRFIFAVASHTPLDHHGASAANGTLRQRLQRAQGSCVTSGWGAGPIACMAVVVNHPARNVLDEAAALPDALFDALKAVGATGGPFVVAVAWSGASSDGKNGASDDNPEFTVCNTANVSVVGWGVRKMRCMIQFALENKEKSVLTNSMVDRLTLLERSKVRLVARVRFHRCMEADDIWAPPLGGVSTTGKAVDEQLRHVNKVTRGFVPRRHGLQERRGLDNPAGSGFAMLANEREKMRAENQERNEIEATFFSFPSLDEEGTVLVVDAVNYWMTCDAEGLDDMVYVKLRRLMHVLEIPHADAHARLDLDKFFVVTNRLRHG